MNLLFRPSEEAELRLYSHSGSWYARLTTHTEITCSNGITHLLPLEYQREITSKDEGTLLDSFETAIRALVADTQEQRMRVKRCVLQLTAALTDECVYSTFVDPCVLAES